MPLEEVLPPLSPPLQMSKLTERSQMSVDNDPSLSEPNRRHNISSPEPHSNSLLKQVANKVRNLMDMMLDYSEITSELKSEVKDLKQRLKIDNNSGKRMDQLSEGIALLSKEVSDGKQALLRLIQEEFTNQANGLHQVKGKLQLVLVELSKQQKRGNDLENEISENPMRRSSLDSVKITRNLSVMNTIQDDDTMVDDTKSILKSVKNTEKLLQNNFTQNLKNNMKISDQISEIDQRLNTYNDIWTEKTNKIEKSNDQISQQINSINKYIRDQKEEMNNIKIIVNENQEKQNYAVLKRIETSISELDTNLKEITRNQSLIDKKFEDMESHVDKATKNIIFDYEAVNKETIISQTEIINKLGQQNDIHNKKFTEVFKLMIDHYQSNLKSLNDQTNKIDSLSSISKIQFDANEKKQTHLSELLNKIKEDINLTRIDQCIDNQNDKLQTRISIEMEKINNNQEQLSNIVKVVKEVIESIDTKSDKSLNETLAMNENNKKNFKDITRQVNTVITTVSAFSVKLDNESALKLDTVVDNTKWIKSTMISDAIKKK